MSGPEERTRPPVPLWSGLDQVLSPSRDHAEAPDEGSTSTRPTAAARDKLVSEVGFQASSPVMAAPRREDSLIDLEDDCGVMDAAATLAALRTCDLHPGEDCTRRSQLVSSDNHTGVGVGPSQNSLVGDGADKLQRFGVVTEGCVSNGASQNGGHHGSSVTSCQQQLPMSNVMQALPAGSTSPNLATDGFAGMSQMLSQLCENVNSLGRMLALSTSSGVISAPGSQPTSVLGGNVYVAQPTQGVESFEPRPVPSTTGRDMSGLLSNGDTGHESRKQRNVMKPQCFDGKESVNSFIAHFEVCAEFNKWSEDEKNHWLRWTLKGRAQQTLWDLPGEQTATYSGIVAALKQRFGSEQQSEIYRIQLSNRRRGAH